MESADGVVGIGEAPSHRYAPLINEVLAPRLVGANPFDLADCDRRCLPPSRTAHNTEDGSITLAYGGIEMALWDLVGKIENRSIASLLGGIVRNEIAFSEYFAFRLDGSGQPVESTPMDIAKYCERMVVEHGAKTLEGKVGVLDLRTELTMVREIRAAVGFEIRLRLDANMAWTVSEARYACRQFEKYDILSIEEPVATLEECARLRSQVTMNFSWHETNLLAAARLGVPDAFVINLAVLGGIRRTLRFIAAAQELGIDVWFYSPDTGVANAAYLQLSAGVEWLSKPSQTLLRWHRDDVVDGGPLQPKDGVLSVPAGPGLGVSLDRRALDRCHKRFTEDGPYEIFGEAVGVSGATRQ